MTVREKKGNREQVGILKKLKKIDDEQMQKREYK